MRGKQVRVDGRGNSLRVSCCAGERENEVLLYKRQIMQLLHITEGDAGPDAAMDKAAVTFPP